MEKERTIDYLIKCHGLLEKNSVYNYLHNKNYKEVHFTKEEILKSKYPIAISVSRKTITIIESATICYMMDKNNRVKDLEEIKDML